MNIEQHISIRFRVYRHTAHDVIRPCISAFKLLVPTSIPTTRIQPMIVRLLCTHMIHRLLAAITLSYDSGVCFRIAFTPPISSPLRLASSRTAPHPSRSFSPPPYSVHTMFASPSSCTTGPHFTPTPTPGNPVNPIIDIRYRLNTCIPHHSIIWLLPFCFSSSCVT